MSTKSTIAHSNDPEQDFHFFEDFCDVEAVYLEIRGKAARFKADEGGVVVRIPLVIWKKIREHDQ